MSNPSTTTTDNSNSNNHHGEETEDVDDDDGGWRPSVRVVLIRHAESANNQVYRNARYIYGGGTAQFDPDGWNKYVNTHRQADPGLSDTVGYPQAEQLAQYLVHHRFQTASATVHIPHPPKFIVSPMRRTCETIRPTLQKLASTSSPQVIIHGEYFESEGCHVCGNPKPGMSPEQIRQVFQKQPPQNTQNNHHDNNNNNNNNIQNYDFQFQFECFPPATETFQGWWNGSGPETREQSETRAARFYLWLGEYLDQQLEENIIIMSAHNNNTTTGTTPTIVLVGHGDFMSLVLKRIIAGPGYFVEHTGIPHRSALVHSNTGITEREYFGKSRYLVLSTNQTPHVLEHPHLISGGTLQDGWSYLIPNDTILQNTQILIAEYHELEHHIREQTQALQSLYWKRSYSNTNLLDDDDDNNNASTPLSASTNTNDIGLSVETDENRCGYEIIDDDTNDGQPKKQRHPHLIVRRGNEVVGVAVFDGRVLSNVAIRPSAGIAATRALVEAAKRHANTEHKNHHQQPNNPPIPRSQSLLVLPRTRQDVQFFEALGFVATEQSSSTSPHLELKH